MEIKSFEQSTVMDIRFCAQMITFLTTGQLRCMHVTFAIGDNRMDPPDAPIELCVHAHFPTILKPDAPLNLNPANSASHFLSTHSRGGSSHRGSTSGFAMPKEL